MTRVLLVAGDATESLDTWYPYHRLREEGIEVHIGAPVKKILKSVVHDFEPGWDTYVEKPGYHIPADIAFADVDPGDYDGIILSGGRAPEYLRNDPQLQKIVRHFVEGKKPIAALCHGVLILAAIDAIRGCTIATYEALAPDVERRRGQVEGYRGSGGWKSGYIANLDGPTVLYARVLKDSERLEEKCSCVSPTPGCNHSRFGEQSILAPE